ncbi:MAG: hypothetical protein U0361_02700 [Nitrospiraceae bacterium]
MMTLWSEGFHRQYLNVNSGKRQGIEHGAPALIEGTAQLGPMSRQMKASEVDAFEGEFGYPPTAYQAIDACSSVSSAKITLRPA